jgi:hypothetical protein
MRRLVTRFLDGLPCDPRSRRALDETLLDWAHEVHAEGSPVRQALIALRNLFAVVRAVVESTARGLIHVPYGWLAGRAMLFALAVSGRRCRPCHIGAIPERAGLT